MVTYEIRYRLGENSLESDLLSFIEEQRIIKKANGGDIDEISLVTGMRVVHYGGLNYAEGKNMGLTPEEDIIDITVKVSKMEVFYPSKEKPEFTVVQIHGIKYMILVSYDIMMQLSRLLKSSVRAFNFAQKVDEDLRNGDLSKKKK